MELEEGNKVVLVVEEEEGRGREEIAVAPLSSARKTGMTGIPSHLFRMSAHSYLEI